MIPGPDEFGTRKSGRPGKVDEWVRLGLFMLAEQAGFPAVEFRLGITTGAGREAWVTLCTNIYQPDHIPDLVGALTEPTWPERLRPWRKNKL